MTALLLFLTLMALAGWLLYMFMDMAYAELLVKCDLLVAELRARDEDDSEVAA